MSTAGTLYSAHWYRVAPLHPRIQPGTKIRRQVLRDEEWFVFSHPVSGRHYRVNRKAYEFVARLDGERSLDHLWKGLHGVLGDELPTQDEVIAALAHLMDAGLVLFDTMPDWSRLQEQRQARRAAERRAELNPFSFSLKLFNPTPLLNRLSALQTWMWHPVALALWLALTAWAVFHALMDWTTIHAYAKVHLGTARGLFFAWLLYPFLKAAHEISHGLAVRRWGGEVKAAGIAFFVLVPAPYVNASAASAFGSKWQRVAVSSAGIMTELFLAALAFIVWSTVEDGLVRDLAFTVMAIGGLSTVVFNANPLLRFDGYYILCDLLEMPNLTSRSKQWWSQQLQRWFRRGPADGLDASGTERFWLCLYTPASWLYRLIISVVIVEWLAGKSTILGFLATLWLIYGLLIKPLSEVLSHVLSPAHPGMSKWKPTMLASGATAALIAAILVVPLPASTMAEGVVWLPERSQVRTASDGRVVEIVARDGQHVQQGDPLVIIEEPPLLAKHARLSAQLRGAETENADGWVLQSRVKGRNAQEDIDRLQSDLAEVEDEIDKLTLRAGVDGMFVFPRAEDTLGRHVPKGALLGYVLAGDPTVVRVAISQDDIGRFKGGVKDVSVNLAEVNNERFKATVLRVDPSSTLHLPSAAFGDKGGGGVVTDPTDRDGVTALEPFYVADVQLQDRHVVRAGAHAWVRFEHTARPLAETALLRFRQLFLRVFSGETA